MSDNPNETEDDAVLTKPKKVRSEAQKAATEKMRASLAAKQLASDKITPTEKKLRLMAIKEQLNGPLKKNIPTPEISETDSEADDQEEEQPPPPPKKKESSKAPVVQTKSIKKKEPKVIYESASESEEEVIIVKKKKKKPKKTIIYESESEEEETPVPKAKSRDTKTQQNSSSKFKVTIPDVKPKGPTYYFAD